MKKIVLFDMDGTLTPPRKELDRDLIPALRELAKVSDIGIVTGSDHNYVLQQMGLLMENSEIRYKLHILPCNGTKYYPPPQAATQSHQLAFEKNMREELGELGFTTIMRHILQRQAQLHLYNIPMTGHFIDYRGSMINWCPIGRNANDEQRKFFVHYDTAYERTYREQLKEQLERKLRHNSVLKHITIKFGGSTSFDIYPNGWDKRYCLTHFNDWETWFVGDKCEDGGNDQELYEHLFDEGQSFKTEDTNQTRLIIDEQIIPNLLQNSE